MALEQKQVPSPHLATRLLSELDFSSCPSSSQQDKHSRNPDPFAPLPPTVCAELTAKQTYFEHWDPSTLP